ncbi:hypothetical protein F511_41017 [Dorcoceras hygrometricum]|uniref:Uncharacterized protein n=1 Tax=Dorcoceras hygrometricum TaxID=472368 RepID=A0A2Z7BYQ3_9LAMI|nr:hypothetical protein F511_41017 [Dorcoceras hygrometricum]
MSLFDLQDVCIAIGSITTLDLPMVVDLIGIYGLKGPYCTLTTTNWFLQTLSMIPRGSWGDVARRSYHDPMGKSGIVIPEPQWLWALLLAVVRCCADVRRHVVHGSRPLAARCRPSCRALVARLTRRRPTCCAPLAARLRRWSLDDGRPWIACWMHVKAGHGAICCATIGARWALAVPIVHGVASRLARRRARCRPQFSSWRWRRRPTTAYKMVSMKNPLAAILDSNKFTGLNYQDWFRNLNLVLASEKLLYTIEKCPPEETPADISPEELITLNQWRDDEVKARCYVMASMSKSQFNRRTFSVDGLIFSRWVAKRQRLFNMKGRRLGLTVKFSRWCLRIFTRWYFSRYIFSEESAADTSLKGNQQVATVILDQPILFEVKYFKRSADAYYQTIK